MTKLTPTDKVALKLAVEACRNESAASRQRLDERLATEPWEKVARFCASTAQTESLCLMPWQVAPCDLTADDLDRDHRRGGHAALALLERMERCGVSQFHPDPVAACIEAERTRAAS